MKITMMNKQKIAPPPPPPPPVRMSSLWFEVAQRYSQSCHRCPLSGCLLDQYRCLSPCGLALLHSVISLLGLWPSPLSPVLIQQQ